VIAAPIERVWVAVAPEGRALTTSIRVSAPQQQPTGEWACTVTLENLASRPDMIHGMDSWQAMQLAMQHAAVRVAHLQSLGWRFYWDANDQASGEPASPSDLYTSVLLALLVRFRQLRSNYVSKPTAGDGLQSFRPLPAGSGLTRR
jgi:hypothetical protein